MATGRKYTFAELYAGVLKGGPATKFAVKSALNNARTKREVKFADGKYASAKTPNARNPVSPPRNGNGNTGLQPAIGE